MERSRQGCGAFATRSVRSASFGATAYTTFDWSTQSTLQLCRPLRRARGRGQSYTAQPTTGPPSPGRSTTSKPTVSRYIDEVDRRISRKPRASARRSATRGLAAVAPWPLRLRPLLWACHRGYFFGASDVHVRLYEPKYTPRVAVYPPLAPLRARLLCQTHWSLVLRWMIRLRHPGSDSSCQ
jgi:hypothetical protein